MSDAIPPHPPLSNYYGDASKRERFVREIFDETAEWYDEIIGMLSFGSGNRYRRDALVRAGVASGAAVLDLATGTGVVARAAARVELRHQCHSRVHLDKDPAAWSVRPDRPAAGPRAL